MQFTPDIPFFFFAVKAIIALSVLAGLPVLVFLLIYGLAKNRTTIAVVAGGLLLLGLLPAAMLFYSVRAMPSPPVVSHSQAWEGHTLGNSATHGHSSTQVSGRITFFSLAVIVAATVAGVIAVVRWFSPDGTSGERVSWSPAWLFLLFVPVLFFGEPCE